MYMEALLLGLIQGLTEFLPISSSAHLALIPQLFHWESPLLSSLSFDVALHLGTFAALLAYFWKDVWDLLTGWLRKGWTREAFADPQAKLAWYLALATIPAVLVALPLEKKIETTFRAPLGIAIILMAAGVLMGWAEFVSRREKSLADMRLGHALLIGCAQALALFPGVSRSGITLTAGLFAGFNRESAARFSFLLALPAVGGACVLHLKHFRTIASGPEAVGTLLGVAVSALVGWLCIHFLLAYLRKSGLYIFMAYRLVAGALVLAWVLLH